LSLSDQRLAPSPERLTESPALRLTV